MEALIKITLHSRLGLLQLQVESDWGITLELRIIFGVQEPSITKNPFRYILYVQIIRPERQQPIAISSKPPSSTQRPAPWAQSYRQLHGTGGYVRQCGGVPEEAACP